MPWKRLPAKASIRTTKPAISIQKNSRIAWNLGTHEALGKPEFVELLFDSETKRLGLRRTEQNEGTFVVRQTGKQKSWGISAKGALDTINISVERSFRRFAEITDDVVFIDIKELLEQLHK